MLESLCKGSLSTLLIREITFTISIYVITIHQRYRRTDRRHTIAILATHVRASRGKKYTNLRHFCVFLLSCSDAAIVQVCGAAGYV